MKTEPVDPTFALRLLRRAGWEWITRGNALNRIPFSACPPSCAGVAKRRPKLALSSVARRAKGEERRTGRPLSLSEKAGQRKLTTPATQTASPHLLRVPRIHHRCPPSGKVFQDHSWQNGSGVNASWHVCRPARV